MTLTHPEIGQRSPSPFRYGPGVPVRGMRLRGDPGAVQWPYWQHLQNIRFDDGFGDRGGSEIMVEGIDGGGNTEIISLFDFQSHRSLRSKLFIVTDGCPGISNTIGASINWLDQEKLAQYSRGPYDSAAVVDPVLGFYDGQLYLAAGATLKVFISIEPDRDVEMLFVAGLGQAEEIKTFPAGTIRFLRSAFGYLFIGLDLGGGASKVVRYDGRAFVDDDTGINAPTAAARFRDELLVVGITGGGLRVRTEAGAWSAVAGAVTPVQMKEYRDELWIVGATTDLWKYNGTALSNERTVAGATMLSLETFDGYLFYGYATATEARLGRRDSAGTYEDVHKNFTTQDGSARSTRQLAFFHGVLVAGVNTTQGAKLFLSPNTDTASLTWELVLPSGSDNGDMSMFATFEED